MSRWQSVDFRWRHCWRGFGFYAPRNRSLLAIFDDCTCHYRDISILSGKRLLFYLSFGRALTVLFGFSKGTKREKQAIMGRKGLFSSEAYWTADYVAGGSPRNPCRTISSVTKNDVSDEWGKLGQIGA